MKFFRRGSSAAHFVPTISNTAAPTVAQITAGVDISAAIASITGFETAPNRITDAVMKYAQEQQTTGPLTPQDASMILLEDDGTGSDSDSTDRQDAYDALEEGATGYIVFFPNHTGITATKDAEVWPVEVSARNRSWSLDTETARYNVAFAITGSAVKDAVIAA